MIDQGLLCKNLSLTSCPIHRKSDSTHCIGGRETFLLDEEEEANDATQDTATEEEDDHLVLK